MNNGIGLLGEIAKKTDSVIIVFFIVIITGLFICLPVVMKAKEKKREQYLDQMKQDQKREEMLLEVIQNNSTVISELSTIMKNNQMSCADCKMEQVVLYKELNKKQELMNTTLEVIKNSLPRAI